MNEQIEKHLAGAGEATAKAIAKAIGLDHGEVVKALHRMTNTALLERAKRPGGGNEYVYWLAGAAPARAAAEAERSEVSGAPLVLTHVALVDENHAPDPNARLLDLPAPANFPCVVAPVVVDDADGDADPELVQADVRISDLLAQIERLTAERDAALAKAEACRTNVAALEARIDELTIGPPGAAAPLFVTIGRNTPPKRHTSLDKAQKRGGSLIQSGKESEVLVLEPIGRMVPGSVWRPR